MTRTLVSVAPALLALGLAACGGSAPARQSTAERPKPHRAAHIVAPYRVTAPTGARDEGSYRFVKAPVVVYASASCCGTQYEVDFRVNRALPRRHVIVHLDEMTDDPSTIGHDGWDLRRGHCYAVMFGDATQYPAALQHPRAGVITTVQVYVFGRRGGTMTIRAPLQERRRSDAFSALGCPAS